MAKVNTTASGRGLRRMVNEHDRLHYVNKPQYRQWKAGVRDALLACCGAEGVIWLPRPDEEMDCAGCRQVAEQRKHVAKRRVREG